MNYIICAFNIGEEIEENLIKLDIIPVKLRGARRLDYGGFHPMNYHPDMFCFNLYGNKWIFYDEAYKINKEIVDNLNINVIIAENPISGEYPHDVSLNAAFVGNNLICCSVCTNKKIIEYANDTGKNIIGVKQGYSKCSICIVDENSIITSDISIYKKAAQNKINVLLIEKGHINLDGYDYGFIGGCSGLINKNKLAFTGNIELHPNYIDIKKFCEGRGVEIISLSYKKLRDYGSLLPVL